MSFNKEITRCNFGYLRLYVSRLKQQQPPRDIRMMSSLHLLLNMNFKSNYQIYKKNSRYNESIF